MSRTIRGLLLSSGSVFAAALFLLGYFTFSAVYERSIRDDAVSDARLIARLTFNGMFQLMRTGWSREQLDQFIASVGQAAEGSPARITVFRSELVSALYGPIAQPDPDREILQALASGRTVEVHHQDTVRLVLPLIADSSCLGCHTNAIAGNVLGTISVAQNVRPQIEDNRTRFTVSGLPAIPLTAIAVLLMVIYINRRLRHSITALSKDIEAVNRVSDLKRLADRPAGLAFSEFEPLNQQISRLTERLRNVAVDREMLEFEIRLLEKFIITSEVVRDWRDYVTTLLVEINSVLPTFALFSIFKIGPDDYEFEVFWLQQPSEKLKSSIEASLRRTSLDATLDHATVDSRINHNIADRAKTIDYEVPDPELQTKSLLINVPKIGGIVGIGLQPEPGEDPARLLVIDSVLSTLLNVVGSVKAIHRYTKELEYYATRDPLTNLYNQRIFWELLDNEIARAARHDTRFVLLLIDLDNFKAINDGHGHAFGDVFLQGVARAIRQAVRPDDMVARYGGDEFVAILPAAGIREGTVVAERILAAGPVIDLVAPDNSVVGASLSIGLAAFPDHATEPKDLFVLADNMLYRAKAEGKKRVRQPSPEDLASSFRAAGERTLQVFSAIEQERFEPHYQPILEISSGRVAAVEVLSRLADGAGGTLPADKFVPMAERMGVMHRIDLIVIRKALEHLSASQFEGAVFVNTSPRALVLDEFIPEIRRIVRATGMDPSRIVFEITERETIRHPGMLEQFIGRLTDEGFRLAIDDFGSGFSSFHYLKRFPFDFLKIEGEFVGNMLNSDRDRAMVRSIVALAKELEIRCLAEHVESEAVLEALRELGLDLAQGFHVGRPSANPDFSDRIDK